MDRSHWYDGWFYDRWIAPNQDALFGMIKERIAPGSTVLDVGCGTGRLSFALADVVSSVVGLDLSLRNIRRARRQLARRPDPRIVFHHGQVSDLLRDAPRRFDVAVLTFMVHEVDADMRRPLLEEVAAIADRVIIGDYVVPRPSGLWWVLDEIVEFVAGREHYRNFRSFAATGGLKGLVRQTSLSIVEEVPKTPRTSQLLVLEDLRASGGR